MINVSLCPRSIVFEADEAMFSAGLLEAQFEFYDACLGPQRREKFQTSE